MPYLQLLVVPLMARMSDPLPPVRSTAAPAFAAIVALVPLAQARTTQAAWSPPFTSPRVKDLVMGEVSCIFPQSKAGSGWLGLASLSDKH